MNGRGDMGRTPVLTRTDLLVSHELRLMGNKRLRFELNVLNLFNQKTATHIFNYLNKGAPGGASTIPPTPSTCRTSIWRQATTTTRLIRATSDGATAVRSALRAGGPLADRLQGQFSVKFIF